MHALSKMCALLASCNARLAAAGDARRLPLPPVFGRCSAVLAPAAEARARDAYWRAVTELRGPAEAAEAAAALEAAVADNPFAAEPRALLAQLALQAGDLAGARARAGEALRLLCDWGTNWWARARGAARALACAARRRILPLAFCEQRRRARCGRKAEAARPLLPPPRVRQGQAHDVGRVGRVGARAAAPRVERAGVARGAVRCARRKRALRARAPGGASHDPPHCVPPPPFKSQTRPPAQAS